MSGLRFWKAAIAVLVLPLVICACKPRTLTYARLHFQLIVPAGWIEKSPPGGSSQIEARNLAGDEFVQVLAEKSADFDTTLEHYAEGRFNHFITHMDNSNSSVAENLTINGYPAIRRELHGTMKQSRAKLCYVVTVLQSKNLFVQVIAWTPESSLAQNEAEMKTLADGFKETD